MISAKILLDSISPAGTRLTTFECTYPRFIHAEVLTHRQLSRNAASSRAIPTATFIERVRNDPALPTFWGANQRGMQADVELPNTTDLRINGVTPLEYVQYRWMRARGEMLLAAEELADLGKVHPEWAGLGLHKQLVNRIIEPWMHITVIVSGTCWENFWHLRAHKAAQPELQALACAMKHAYDNNVARHLKVGEWHLPLIDDETYAEVQKMVQERYPNSYAPVYVNEMLLKISTGRCARVSYLTHDGVRDINKDIQLHDKLLSGQVTGEPLHMSPFEHPARALEQPVTNGNFIGFEQYRKTIKGEAGPPERTW